MWICLLVEHRRTAGQLSLTDSGVSDPTLMWFWLFLHWISGHVIWLEEERLQRPVKELHTHARTQSRWLTLCILLLGICELFVIFRRGSVNYYSGNVLCVAIYVDKMGKPWQSSGFCLHFRSLEGFFFFFPAEPSKHANGKKHCYCKGLILHHQIFKHTHTHTTVPHIWPESVS